MTAYSFNINRADLVEANDYRVPFFTGQSFSFKKSLLSKVLAT